MAKHTGRNLLSALLWSLVEPIAAAVVGIISYFPLGRKDLAYIAWMLGVLFAFSSVTTVKRLKDEFETTRKLSESLDLYLSQRSEVQHISDILHYYLQVMEVEFEPIKTRAVDQCRRLLGDLARNKRAETSGTEYYLWLSDLMQRAQRKEHIYAVSVMEEMTPWNEALERRYLDENVEAARRGATIERIFVTSKAVLAHQGNKEVILKHLQHGLEGLVTYIVWRDQLQQHDPALLKDVGLGFVVFEHRVALIDEALSNAEARGTISMDRERVEHCRRVFDQLKVFAVPANERLLDTN